MNGLADDSVSIPSNGLAGGTVVWNPPTNAGDAGSIPGLERSPREGNGNPLQNFCLGNPMDRGSRQATVHGVAKGPPSIGEQNYP